MAPWPSIHLLKGLCGRPRDNIEGASHMLQGMMDFSRTARQFTPPGSALYYFVSKSPLSSACINLHVWLQHGTECLHKQTGSSERRTGMRRSTKCSWLHNKYMHQLVRLVTRQSVNTVLAVAWKVVKARSPLQPITKKRCLHSEFASCTIAQSRLRGALACPKTHSLPH